jgi:hypothetical protein
MGWGGLGVWRSGQGKIMPGLFVFFSLMFVFYVLLVGQALGFALEVLRWLGYISQRR